jgi:tetratricopeptide (TPR) repeat protein
MLKSSPQDERIHSSLGITYAGLGLRDKAIFEGKKGIELLPLEKEAYRGYYRQWDLAIIYTLLGDNDNALKQIDYILSIPGEFSVNLLKLDPLYDSLRGLPGYKAIINKYE